MKIRIQDLWAMVPIVRCKGLCTDQCTVIEMSRAERELMEERIPDYPSADKQMAELRRDGFYRCPALVDGRCTVYDVRPLICRLWGAEEALPCPHGCEVVGGRLPHSEGSALVQISLDVGGAP